ncbi:MAG: ribonuclease Z [Clostridia bacterium]|nr:ribonuclease Z [Clostridia bacterium]
MKITFLGTSHGVVEKNRHRSSAMIEVGNAIYLIDAGAPVVDELINHDKKIQDVKAIFTTHRDGDHVNGLLTYAELLNWFYKDASVDIYMTEQVLIDAFKNLIKLVGNGLDENRIRFNLFDEKFVYKDENIKVSFIPTCHLKWRGLPAYSIFIEAEGKKVLFSGDLSNGIKENDVPKILFEEEIDAFICELAHFSIDEIKPYLLKSKTKAVYFNHIGYPTTRFEDVKELNGELNILVKSVNDGDEIEF